MQITLAVAYISTQQFFDIKMAALALAWRELSSLDLKKKGTIHQALQQVERDTCHTRKLNGKPRKNEGREKTE